MDNNDGYVLKVEAEINLPAEKIDLADWLLNMTDDEYISCSKNHIAMGKSKNADGKDVLINVESTADNKFYMVHHYIVERAEKNRTRVKSYKSIYLVETPFYMPITWEMSINPNGKSSTFICEVTVEGFSKLFPDNMPADKKKRIISKTKVSNDTHLKEETPLFAKLIEKKFSMIK
jgi:hypothetical protein